MTLGVAGLLVPDVLVGGFQKLLTVEFLLNGFKTTEVPCVKGLRDHLADEQD